MRLKDEKKKYSIFNAAMELITTNGFAETSMAQIAERAQVSAATIYIYFQNKEDLLNKLFLYIKEESAETILNGVSDVTSVKMGLQLFWSNTYQYSIANPIKFAFGEQFSNSPLINRLSKDEGRYSYQPLFELLNKGIVEGILKDVPLYLLATYVLAPLTQLIKAELNREIKISEQLLTEAFSMAWDAIKI